MFSLSIISNYKNVRLAKAIGRTKKRGNKFDASSRQRKATENNSVGPVEQASNKQKGLQKTQFKGLFSSDAFVTTHRNKVLFIYNLHLYYMYLRIPCELGLSWQTHWPPGEPIFGSFLLKGFWTN